MRPMHARQSAGDKILLLLYPAPSNRLYEKIFGNVAEIRKIEISL